MLGQAGEEGVIRALGSAEDTMKAISWWMKVGLKGNRGGDICSRHSSGTTAEPSNNSFLSRRHQRPKANPQCLMPLLPGTYELWKAISVDVNLLRVRASVHGAVSLLWYYIPVCFSKGSPITLHLGREARELWMHRAQGLWPSSQPLGPKVGVVSWGTFHVWGPLYYP